jgi:hypothetical protein
MVIAHIELQTVVYRHGFGEKIFTQDKTVRINSDELPVLPELAA